MDLFNPSPPELTEEEIVYQIVLTFIKGIGNVNARNLIGYCGSVPEIFRLSKRQLLKVPGVGEKTANAILSYRKLLPKVHAELEFVKSNQLKTLFCLDKAYPKRLTNCSDAPLLLYYKGNVALNAKHIISVVGTRDATRQGMEICEQLVKDLAKYNPLIVSGLAYGIDHEIHRACVKNGVATVAVLGHGLDRIYPIEHVGLAKKIVEKGGLLSEFTKGTSVSRENFPRRNRIVAGMTDATIVVETGLKGGSMVTTHLASSYNREVFAFPGRIKDRVSKGCNFLIKQNIAALIESGRDVAENLGWVLPEENGQSTKQVSPWVQQKLTAEETLIVHALHQEESKHIDLLSLETKLPNSKVSTLLLTMEFKGIIKALPGKCYKLL